MHAYPLMSRGGGTSTVMHKLLIFIVADKAKGAVIVSSGHVINECCNAWKYESCDVFMNISLE